jgi:hypothetical protein
MRVALILNVQYSPSAHQTYRIFMQSLQGWENIKASTFLQGQIDANMPEAVDDGVHRYPSNGIMVIILGAGVGGLHVALECWGRGATLLFGTEQGELSPLGE